MDFDQYWNSQAADAFRALHENVSGEVFRPIWNAAVESASDDSKRKEVVGDIRHYLHEAWGFAAMSPRGKENISSALELLYELEK